MPRKSPYTIDLTREERETLERRSRRYTLPYRDVVRAKIILLAAEGLENKAIGERLDLPREVASKWRKRFYQRRMAGLEEKPRRGRPPGSSPSDRV
ncbi:MAG: helix-turn-helix domain-containing protein [Candidatus Palauibacterales bacterium]|nr:helix-turn-helix domain-containing protein [Candidatus Palauibacterales bacterium]MDP2529274.1 helix-turn-helix domain-containing protein [Candidatus Palauibacterales bacterium]MDP2583319.1 helix-turn-helix domain-containing protein [Candidatus Palauibacterales bacterium]